MSSIRGQLRARRVAELAERQRRRTGMWFNQAGRICQHCPRLRRHDQHPGPPGTDDPAGFDAYARITARLRAPDYRAWRAQVEATRGCAAPIHLHGSGRVLTGLRPSPTSHVVVGLGGRVPVER